MNGTESGGKLILPTTGHSSGCLQVRDRITFGKNPTKTPYVFNPDNRTTKTLTWQLGVNTEYRVDCGRRGDPRRHRAGGVADRPLMS